MTKTLTEELLVTLRELNLRHDTTTESPVNMADAHVLAKVIENRLRAYVDWSNRFNHSVKADYFCREHLR